MAVRIVSYRLDDVELAKGAEVQADRTVKFALDGQEYEIDLTKDNIGVLRKDLGPWMKNARKTTRRRVRRRHDPGLREWARSKGYDVKPSGRVPDKIVAEYEASLAAA